MNKIASLVLTFFVSSPVMAEELVRFPDGPATWTISCEKKETTPPPGEAQALDAKPMVSTLKTIEVAQTENASRSILRWSNGKSREIWSFPKQSIMVTEDPSGKAFTTRNAISFGNPFGPFSFNWIKPDTQKSDKPIKFDGVQCNHYVGFIQIPGMTEKDVARTIPCEAWINAETRLPVALLKGDIQGKFSFGPPPQSLEMPQKFKELLEYNRMTEGG